MKRYALVLLFACFVVSVVCAEADQPAIIPAPQKMEISEGEFRLLPTTQIRVDDASTHTAEYLAARLRISTGYRLPLYTNSEPQKGVIRLTTNGANPDLGVEGYELKVKSGNVVEITAPAQAGLFYGAQTLLQLFPPQIFSRGLVTNINWEIPFVDIQDQPRFKWRGFMLDVSRHFYTKEDVKRVLDEMALHKLNMFHWHLTDDQSWRIEIKKYPKLTEVGAWRTQSDLDSPQQRESKSNPGNNAHPGWAAVPPTAYAPDGRYGGFYTQQDIREIVAYAAERHITVVPEIEMPGHAVAALAAYPELSCDDGHYSTDVAAGINKGVFCVGKDATFKFLDDVLTEVFELFPGKYIHVGGDEVNAAVKADTWGKCASCQARMKAEGMTNLDQLQGWFTGQIGKFVSAHGKTIVGWSEIAESPLPNDAVLMDWRGGALSAATNGHDVVMSPGGFCYFDHYQSLDHGTEPLAIGGFLPLEKVYAFDPVPAELPAEFQSRILGGQANLWTEYVASFPHVEYMMFPRLSALAEAVWSPKSARDWNSFSRRLKVHEVRLDLLGVNYRPDLSVKIGEWTSSLIATNDTGTNLEWNVTSEIKGSGQYRVTFERTHGNGLMINSVSLLKDGVEVARDNHDGFAASHPTKPVYVLDLGKKDNAGYTLRASVTGSGSSGIVSMVFHGKTQ